MGEVTTQSRAHRLLVATIWGLAVVGMSIFLSAQDGSIAVRSIGAWLQLLGVATVAIEIVLTLHPHDSLGDLGGRIWDDVRRRFRRLLGITSARAVQADLVGPAPTADGRIGTPAGVWADPEPGEIDERLARHDEKLRDLHQRLERSRDEAKNALTREAERLDALVRDLRADIDAELARRDSLREVETARQIPVRWQGVALLLAGIILASWPGAIHEAGTALTSVLATASGWIGVVALWAYLFIKLQQSS